MDDETKREIFGRAQDARAHLNTLERYVTSESAKDEVRTIRHNLEMIERRTDPAADPDYEPPE